MHLDLGYPVWYLMDNLYFSGLPHDAAYKNYGGIEAVINVTTDPTPDGDELPFYLHAPIADGGLPDKVILDAIVEIGHKISGKYKLLVHCLEGRNRSGLIAGCIMRKHGIQADAIIASLHSANPYVLKNQVFRDYIKSL